MSKSVYDEMVAAGAPELKDGFFYRVTPEDESFLWTGDGPLPPPRYYLTVRRYKTWRERLWWGFQGYGFRNSVQVGDRVEFSFYPNGANVVPMVRAAQQWKTAEDERQARRDLKNKERRFVGDHP